MLNLVLRLERSYNFQDSIDPMLKLDICCFIITKNRYLTGVYLNVKIQ
jgi:hypothetical protein